MDRRTKKHEPRLKGIVVIPDYQTLMRPVLKCSESGEVRIYIQAKRYAQGNNVGAGDIRDFFGALNLKKAHKGIFITTSAFSSSAIQTANDFGSRIVLIDGVELAKLMLRYNIGCRNEDVLYLKKIDEDFFES